MPNVIVHAALADRVLQGWEGTEHRPFDPSDPVLRNAFYQGSWGPDMGYFPGGHAFFSDLSHYVRTGELARTLVRTARDDRERAFAWGWVGHVLADQALHPQVGRAVHEQLHGTRDGFVEAFRAKPEHVRIEVGLDVRYARLHPGIPRLVPAPVFDRSSVRWLGGAFRETYGLDIDPELLLTSHLTTTRMARRALQTIGIMADLYGNGGGDAAGSARQGLVRAARTGLESLGVTPWMLVFLDPADPPAWLMEVTEKVVEGFRERFGGLYGEGLDALPDYNLDSGTLLDRPPHHPCALQARRVLQACGPPTRYRGSTNFRVWAG